MPSQKSWFKASFKRQLIWLLPLAGLMGLIILMVLSGSGQVIEPPIKVKKHLVEAAPVKWQQSYLFKRLVFGQVEAPQTADIGFELAGSVSVLLVDEGEGIEKGQVLAKLDTKSLKAQLIELSAMQKRATAEANLAALSYKRVVELVSQKLEPAQRLDESEQSLNMANAYVEELLARQQKLQLELNKADLVAPFNGSVVARMVDHGTVVNPSQAIFRVQQNGPLLVRFAMPTNYAQSFTLGKSISLSAGNERFDGQVKSISAVRRLDTRTVDMIASFNEPNLSILAGDSVNLEFSKRVEESGIWIPRKALISGVRGLWSLFVAKPDDDGYQLTTKLVNIIYADQSDAFISGALKDGDMLIISGVQRLVPGQKVQLTSSRAN